MSNLQIQAKALGLPKLGNPIQIFLVQNGKRKWYGSHPNRGKWGGVEVINGEYYVTEDNGAITNAQKFILDFQRKFHIGPCVRGVIHMWPHDEEVIA